MAISPLLTVAGALATQPILAPLPRNRKFVTLLWRELDSKIQFRATVGGLAGLRNTRSGQSGSHRSSFRLTSGERTWIRLPADRLQFQGFVAVLPTLRRSAGSDAARTDRCRQAGVDPVVMAAATVVRLHTASSLSDYPGFAPDVAWSVPGLPLGQRAIPSRWPATGPRRRRR